jgi:hypothetical protein
MVTEKGDMYTSVYRGFVCELMQGVLPHFGCCLTFVDGVAASNMHKVMSTIKKHCPHDFKGPVGV